MTLNEIREKHPYHYLSLKKFQIQEEISRDIRKRLKPIISDYKGRGIWDDLEIEIETLASSIAVNRLSIDEQDKWHDYVKETKSLAKGSNKPTEGN